MIVDAHLDLAFSALNFGRNLSNPLATIRADDPAWASQQGIASVCIEALLAGGVGLVLGTLFTMPKSMAKHFANTNPALLYEDDSSAPLSYRQDQAHAAAMKQYDYYRRLADEDGRVRLVRNQTDMEAVLVSQDGEQPLLGIVLHMEGAQPVRDSAEIEQWYEYGLRSIGPAWDDTRYAPGQWHEAGRLPKDGYALLERMLSFNMLCDTTHMSEAAAWDVLEMYDGPLAATHCNARALVNSPRQLSDRQIRALAERNGVIGTVLYNQFLRKEHAHGDAKELVTLDHVVAHIDHICQVVGSADHVGIGSDMDGGFGAQDLPTGIDSSADLPKIAVKLKERGYDDAHIAAIMSGNWLRLLKRTLV